MATTMRRFIFWFILFAVAAAGYFYRDKVLAYLPGHGAATTADSKPAPGGGKKGAAPLAVAVAKAETGSLPITRQTIGTVVALATANLTGSVTGLLAEVHVDDGASVKKGDLIAQLDSRAIRATIAKDQATQAKDQATLDNANLTLKRTLDLVGKGVLSTQNGDDAATAAKVAVQAVNVDNAAVNADQVALALTEIRAPFDGRLGTILLSPGAWVGATSIITTITQIDPVYAEFVLPDADVQLMRKNFASGALSASVVPQMSKTAKSVSGPIVFLDNFIDPASGTMKMRAKLPNADQALLVGQSLSINVSAGTMDNLVLVPNVAVSPTATGNAVYVVKDDNTIEVRSVEIAMRGDKLAGISKGLQTGEQVVTEGQVNLSNGTSVKIGAATAAVVDPTKKDNNSKTKKDSTATTAESAAP